MVTANRKQMIEDNLGCLRSLFHTVSINNTKC